jgi:hypothetical protein
MTFLFEIICILKLFFKFLEFWNLFFKIFQMTLDGDTT